MLPAMAGGGTAWDEHAAAWLREQHGDQLVACVRVHTPVVAAISTSTRPGATFRSTALSPLLDAVAWSGRSREQWLPLLFGDPGLLAVSDSAVRVIRLGGFRSRPKATVWEVPIADVVVHHLDADGKNDPYRCWIIELADGRFVAESTILRRDGKGSEVADGADRFLAALGHRARPLASG